MARKAVLLVADPAARQLNPYLRLVFDDPALLAGAEVGRLGIWPDGARNLHLHWPEFLLHHPLCRRSAWATEAAYTGLVRRIDQVRARGGRLVWTAHNLAPHGFPAPHSAAAHARWGPRLLARVDRVVAMAPSVAVAVRPLVPDARIVEIAHPHYRRHYAASDGRTLRRRLGVPAGAHLTCAVGLVRSYKRIPQMIAAFAAAARGDEYLLVAGACHEPGLAAEVARAAARNARVRLLLEPLDDAGFAEAVRAGDLFVANFGAVLNSGSVLAALSLDRPVLAPRLGALADLQAQVGAAWLRLFEGDLAAGSWRQLLDAARAAGPEGWPDLRPNEPAAVAAAHLGLYI